jgi:hypothetical protein
MKANSPRRDAMAPTLKRLPAGARIGSWRPRSGHAPQNLRDGILNNDLFFFKLATAKLLLLGIGLSDLFSLFIKTIQHDTRFLTPFSMLIF